MVALGTVLSFIKIDMPMGGGVTLASMVPLVVIAYRWGWKWGGITGLVYSVLQMILGLDNVQYATSTWMAIAIVMLDYILAYTVIGFAPVFAPKKLARRGQVAVGSAVACFLRFVCHFFSGWLIWDALWPNELGLAAPIYSLYYNGSYMAVELVITVVVASLLMPTVDKIKK